MAKRLSNVLSQGKSVVLADGKEYKLYPKITLNMLASLEDKFDMDIFEGFGKQKRQAAFTRYLLYLLLSKFQVDITEEDVGELVGIGEIGVINGIIDEIMKDSMPVETGEKEKN